MDCNIDLKTQQWSDLKKMDMHSDWLGFSAPEKCNNNVLIWWYFCESPIGQKCPSIGDNLASMIWTIEDSYATACFFKGPDSFDTLRHNKSFNI